MAVTRLADVVVPEVFYTYMQLETMEKAGFWNSGIVQPNAKLAEDLAGGGSTFQAPFWNDLDNTESDVASDDPAVNATPGKITAGKMSAIRQVRTRGWSSARLTKELAGDDPQKAIVSRTSNYWGLQYDSFAVSTIRGVLASNIANNAGDFFRDITGLAGSAAQINASAILEAKQTMGDAAGMLTRIIMHSVIYTNLQKQQLITFIPNARGEVTIPTYLGYRVVLSDRAPVTAVGADFHYDTILCSEGFLGYAEHPVDKPVEIETKPAAANGMGVEELWTRRQFALHPAGFHWTDAVVAGEFPRNAELANAANWVRRFPERKQYPIAVVRSKNG